MKYDRFINNTILTGLVRPQYTNECSINAVTGALNAITDGQLRREDIYEITGWDSEPVTNGDIGNVEVLRALRKCCKHLNISATVSLFINSISRYEKLWTKFKEAVRYENTALIYHADNHYCLIAGYFEEPWNRKCLDTEGYQNRRDWIILADHSSDRNPIRTITWSDARDELNEYSGYGILRIQKLNSKR